jgi:hypothetical protein
MRSAIAASGRTGRCVDPTARCSRSRTTSDFVIWRSRDSASISATSTSGNLTVRVLVQYEVRGLSHSCFDTQHGRLNPTLITAKPQSPRVLLCDSINARKQFFGAPWIAMQKGGKRTQVQIVPVLPKNTLRSIVSQALCSGSYNKRITGGRGRLASEPVTLMRLIERPIPKP